MNNFLGRLKMYELEILDGDNLKQKRLVNLEVLARRERREQQKQERQEQEQIKQQSLVEVRRKSYIKGWWIANILPEDWRGELEVLRYELLVKKKRNVLINFITVVHLLDMFKAHLQIKLENIWFFNKEVSSLEPLTKGELKTNNHRVTVSFFDFKS